MGATRNTGYLENLIQYDASDNVAIATTVNPSYKVTLGGSMLGTSAVFSGNLTVNGNLFVSNSTADNNSATILNTSATGYGLRVSGGQSGDNTTRYAFRVSDYQNNPLFSVYGGGAATFSSSVQIGTTPATAGSGLGIGLPFDTAIRWRNSTNSSNFGFYFGGTNQFYLDAGLVASGRGIFSVTQGTSSIQNKITTSAIGNTIITDYVSSSDVSYAYIQTKIIDNNTVLRHRGELSFFIRKDNASYVQGLTLNDSGDIIVNASCRSLVGFSLYKGNTSRGGVYDYSSISGAGTDYSTTIFSETGQGIYFAANGSVTKMMTITSGGNVGIGTTSPATGVRLDVNGVIRAVSTKITSFSATVNGGTTGNIDFNLNSILGTTGVPFGSGEIIVALYINGGTEGNEIYKITFGGYLDPAYTQNLAWGLSGTQVTNAGAITVNSLTLPSSGVIRLNVTNSATNAINAWATIMFFDGR